MGNPPPGYPARMPYHSDPPVPRSLKQSFRKFAQRNKHNYYGIFFVLGLTLSGWTLVSMLVSYHLFFLQGFAFATFTDYYYLHSIHSGNYELNIERSAPFPIINTFTDIQISAQIVPEQSWSASTNPAVQLQDRYFLVFTGSNCSGTPSNSLADGQCYLLLQRSNNYANALAVKYPSDRSYDVFLDNSTKFAPSNGEKFPLSDVISNQLNIQRIVTAAFLLVLLSAFIIAFLCIIEIYRRKAQRNAFASLNLTRS